MERPAILYVTSRSLVPDSAFRHAVRLAEGLGASLSFLHVHRGQDPTPASKTPFAIDRLTHQARDHGVEVEVIRVGRSGRWSEELAELDWDSWQLALKVAEPEHRLRRFLGATVDQRLARAPGIPVWFVPPSMGAGLRVVLAAVDAAHPDHAGLSAAVVRASSSLAAAGNAHLHLLHAWSMVGESIVSCPVRGAARPRVRGAMRRVRDARRRRLEDLAGLAEVEVTPVLARGLPEETLRRAARSLGADHLVLGTLARDGVEGSLVGNFAERFVGRDGLGVLVVKEDGPVPAFTSAGVAA